MAAVLSNTNADWSMLVAGGQSLVHGAGLHTYARSPYLQAGPPSLVIASAISAGGAQAGSLIMHTLLIACVVLALLLAERGARRGAEWRDVASIGAPAAVSVMGLVSLVALCRLVHVSGSSWFLLPLGMTTAGLGCWLSSRLRRGSPVATADPVAARLLMIGLPTVVAWGSLAGGGHIDDGLAMLALSGLLYAVSVRAPLWSGVTLGIAIALKPWAIVGLPMLLGVSEGRRRATAIAIAIPAACWLPFILGDHGTLAVTNHGFPVNAAAAVRLLGLRAVSAPSWLRTAELALALVVALISGHRDGWSSAVPAGMVARLLLDPANLVYYTSTTVLACAMGDLQRRRLPWRTAALWCGLWAAPLFVPSVIDAPIRAATLLIVVGSYFARMPSRHTAGRTASVIDVEPSDVALVHV